MLTGSLSMFRSRQSWGRDYPRTTAVNPRPYQGLCATCSRNSPGCDCTATRRSELFIDADANGAVGAVETVIETKEQRS